MNNKMIDESLGDLIIEDVFAMSDKEVADEFNRLGINQEATVRSIRRIADSVSLEYRKSRLIKAKSSFQSVASETRNYKSLRLAISSSGGDVREYLAKLLSAGAIPQEITMAFRDGKEISEDEALSIMEDLIELGILSDDESEDPR